MKIIILGGCGYIGSVLTDILLKKIKLKLLIINGLEKILVLTKTLKLLKRYKKFKKRKILMDMMQLSI